ncbi:MAG: hypothetical protein KF773_22645 [Deltaproteobacteria bacterium]|nr:hypothetical protein [Deltaproteobacteria bacterium]MCW5808300.1 hypothetical protein [Deltaproteobacteria bacterium]
MARSVTRTWYRVGLVRADDSRVLVAAQGEHLGVAIASAEEHAHGRAIAAEVASGDAVPLGDSVGKQPVVVVPDVPELHAAGAFAWPSGVIPQLAGAAQLAGARRGYTIHPDPELLVIEAQTDAEHLVDLYLGLLERLPYADNLEVRVLDHFEDTGTTDVWLTSRVNAKKILRFLDDNDVELLGNGHLELSVYVRQQKATLRLTQHKTVVWLAENGAFEDEITRWLRELAVPRVDDNIAITGAPHFHYRPAKSHNRKWVDEELYKQRLRKVDTLKA